MVMYKSNSVVHKPCLHGTTWSRSVSGFNSDSVV